MDAILDYLSQKMKEPSTWISLGALATAVGWKISPADWSNIALFGMGIGGLLGVILSERKKTSPTEIKAVVENVVKPAALEPIQPAPKELEAAMKEATK